MHASNNNDNLFFPIVYGSSKSKCNVMSPHGITIHSCERMAQVVLAMINHMKYIVVVLNEETG